MLADLVEVAESSNGQIKERKTDVFQQIMRKQLQLFGHIWQGRGGCQRNPARPGQVGGHQGRPPEVTRL